MLKHIKITVCLMLFVTASVFAQQNAVSDTTWHGHSVNNEYINGQLDSLAIQYKQYAPIPKMGIYDIGYPRDAKEFDRLDGYSLLLVAALSQTKEEIPIKRVYVSLNGKDVDLTRLNMFLSQNEDTFSQTSKTFGSFRMDAIYAFPVYLRLQASEIFIEFGKDPKPMTLAKFNGETPAALKALPNRQPKGNSYPQEALQQFMKREYPGYFEK